MTSSLRVFVLPVVLIVVVALLAGCSRTPGEGKIAELIERDLQAEHPGLMVVEDLEKHNGWSDNDQHYAAEVSYTLKFEQSFSAYVDHLTNQPGNPVEKVSVAMSAGMLKLQYGNFNAGDKYRVKQHTVTFRQTDNGWALVK